MFHCCSVPRWPERDDSSRHWALRRGFPYLLHDPVDGSFPRVVHSPIAPRFGPRPERKLTVIREAAVGGAPIVVSAAGSRDEAHVAWFNRGRFYVTTQTASSDAATVRLLTAGGEPQITIVGDQLISASIENGEVIAR